MSLTLLVDGTNIAMFAAFGGKIPPAQSTRSALAAIDFASNQMTPHADRVFVAFDSPTPTLRKRMNPTYKAGRKVDTQPYITALHRACVQRGIPTVFAEGYEADDIVATMASRRTGNVAILSNDSDVLALINDRVCVYRPKKIREIAVWGVMDVIQKYGVTPSQLPLYKALVGEPGDNIAGVQGIGPKTAAALINDAETDWKPFDQHLDVTLPLTTLIKDVPL